MSIRQRLSASSVALVAVIATAVTVAAQSAGDRSQPSGTPSASRPNEPTATSPAASTAPSAPAPSTTPSTTQPVSQPTASSSTTQPSATTPVGVPRSVAPDAGTPPAARAAPACGATDQARANNPPSSSSGVSADQFQRAGVPTDAFVRPGVSAAQAGGLLPGVPNAPCTPPRDVVLYPDTTPPRRSPPPQN